MKLVLLTVIALSLIGVATGSQRKAIESTCDDIETSFFNFFIKIEINEDDPNCDLEEIGGKIQEVLNDIEKMVPDRPEEDESLEAIVCPFPEMARRLSRALHGMAHRILGKRRRRRRYAYSGGSTCRKCAVNDSDRKLGGPVQACDLSKDASREIEVDDKFCEDAEEVQEDLVEYAEKLLKDIRKDKAKGKNDPKKLEETQVMQFVENGNMHVKGCYSSVQRVMAALTMAEEACEESKRAEKEKKPDSYQVGLGVAVGIISKSAKEDAKRAQGAVFETEKEILKLEEAVLKAKSKKRMLGNVSDSGRKLVPNPRQLACGMAEGASRVVTSAEKSCKAAEKEHEKLKEYAKTLAELDDTQDATKFVEKGQPCVEECYACEQRTMAVSTMVEKTCEEAQRSSDKDESIDYLDGLDFVANALLDSAQEEAQQAEEAFYKTKHEKMNVKEALLAATFRERHEETEATEKDLQAQLEEDLTRMDANIKDLEIKMKVAKEANDKEEETRIEKEIGSLKASAVEMKDELKTIQRQNDQEHAFDYKFESEILDVEAANTLEDWYKEFADLIEMLLPEELHEEFKQCFDEDPKVDVKVVPLDSDEDKLTEDDCPVDWVV